MEMPPQQYLKGYLSAKAGIKRGPKRIKTKQVYTDDKIYKINTLYIHIWNTEMHVSKS